MQSPSRSSPVASPPRKETFVDLMFRELGGALRSPSPGQALEAVAEVVARIPDFVTEYRDDIDANCALASSSTLLDDARLVGRFMREHEPSAAGGPLEDLVGAQLGEFVAAHWKNNEWSFMSDFTGFAQYRLKQLVRRAFPSDRAFLDHLDDVSHSADHLSDFFNEMRGADEDSQDEEVKRARFGSKSEE